MQRQVTIDAITPKELRDEHTEMTRDQLNNLMLDSIQQKKVREAKAEELKKQNAVTNSTAWYLLAWNYIASSAFGVQKALLQIPSFLYPANPGNSTLFSSLGITHGFSFLSVLSPVILVLSWINTSKVLKDLYQKNDRTMKDYAKAALNLNATLLWTTLFVLGAASALAVVAPVLPYIAIAVFSAFALNGLVDSVYSLYKAWESRHDSKLCHAHLKNAAKGVLSIITNTLAVVLSVFLGMRINEASAKMQDNLFEGIAALGDAFTAALPVFIAYTAATIASITVSTAKMNDETWDAIRNPAKIKYAIKENPFLLLNIINPLFYLKLVSLVTLGPIQKLVQWISKGLVSNEKAETISSTPAATKSKTDIVAESQLSLEEFGSVTQQKMMAGNLIAEINNKIKGYDEEFPIVENAPEKIQAKRFYLSHLKNYVERKIMKQEIHSARDDQSIKEILKDSKVLSQDVYGSLYSTLFYRKGTVVQLTRDVIDCENKKFPLHKVKCN